MTSDWAFVRLADSAVTIIDGDRGSNYPKQSDFFSDEFCLFLNAGNVTKEGFSFENCSFITKEKDAQLRKGKLNREDVVLTTRGTVGNVGYYSSEVKFNEIRINSGMVILRAKPDTILPRYLYFFLRSSLFKDQVNSLVSGSAQPQLPIRDLNFVEIPLPPYATQDRICEFLGLIDDRISTLRKSNSTLEAMAQAIFKSWFIDFEPVREKLNKNYPQALGKSIATLFPNEFEDSALGKIPKGWTICDLSDAIVFNDGKTWSSKERVEFSEIPTFGANGKVGFAQKPLGTGRVIFLGKIGSCGALNFHNGKWWATNNCFYIQRNDNPGLEWCRGVILGVNFKSYVGGSSNPYMPLKNFAHHKIVKPTLEVISAFEKICSPIREKIEFNEALADYYSDLRDTLLPRLISGQLRLSDAQAEVEALTT